MGIANVLTYSRLILVPVFIAILFMKEYGWALAVFCFAGFTDLIDGTIARFFKETSNEGAMVDPLADKLLLGSAFVSLCALGLIPLWFLLIAVGRDLMIMSGIYYLKRIHAPLPYRPTSLSKFATLLQLVIAVWGLVQLWRGGEATDYFSYLLVLTGILLLVTGIQYVFMGIELKRRRVIPS